MNLYIVNSNYFVLLHGLIGCADFFGLVVDQIDFGSFDESSEKERDLLLIELIFTYRRAGAL